MVIIFSLIINIKNRFTNNKNKIANYFVDYNVYNPTVQNYSIVFSVGHTPTVHTNFEGAPKIEISTDLNKWHIFWKLEPSSSKEKYKMMVSLYVKIPKIPRYFGFSEGLRSPVTTLLVLIDRCLHSSHTTFRNQMNANHWIRE